MSTSFGKQGTRTAHHDEAGGVIDRTAGESLICTVEPRGGTPTFVFACTHRTLFTPEGILDRYQWTVFDQEGASAANGDVHVLTVLFSGGTLKYRFKMEVFDANFALVKTLKDIEYESTDPTDFLVEPILLGSR